VLRDPRRYGIKNTTDKVRRPGELESRGYVRIADYSATWRVIHWKSVNTNALND
jgi:hypothetical protein